MADHLTFAVSESKSDLFLDKNGNLAMASGREAILYVTQSAIRTVRGEVMYDTGHGVPYFTTIFASPPNLPMWEFYVKDTALTVPGVLSVASFKYEVKNKAVSYEMVMETEDGTVYMDGGGGNTLAAQNDPDTTDYEPVPWVSILAPYAWIDINGSTVYTETRDLSSGALAFNTTSITERVLAGETEEQARERLANSVITEVYENTFIVTDDNILPGGTTTYWRNQTEDIIIGSTYTSIMVKAQEFPRGLIPTDENNLYRETYEGESIVAGNTTGRLFFDASETDEFNPAYTVQSVLVSQGGTWSNTELIIGNYSATGDYGVQPYLVITGNTAVVELEGDGELVPTLYREMQNFSGSTYAVTVWVTDEYYQNPPSGERNFPKDMPVAVEGALVNTDYVTVRTNRNMGEAGYIDFAFNGLYYRNGGSGSPTGYVFDYTRMSAMNWKVSPIHGTKEVYTYGVNGGIATDKAYETAEFTGATYSILNYGQQIQTILTNRGGTFYNPL